MVIKSNDQNEADRVDTNKFVNGFTYKKSFAKILYNFYCYFRKKDTHTIVNIT